MSDWAVECGLTQVAQREIPEDWDSRTWEFPDDPLVDARSRHLDAVIAGFHQNEDCAMFADGGRTLHVVPIRDRPGVSRLQSLLGLSRDG